MSKPIKVLYEDDYFVVFDKPAGLLVIPTPKKEKNTLVNIVNAQYSVSQNDAKLHPCHRLDRDTSGVIIFAKGKRNQQLMREEFQKLAVQKTYIAIIHGTLQKIQGEMRSPIRDLDQQKYHYQGVPRLAITRYKVIEIRRGYSVLEVYPITGRTNQIRIQLSEVGHPLLGERKYAFARDYTLKFRRPALHAHRLRWQHPINRKYIEVKSPLPEDMRFFLATH